jgi:hypothetical protein
MKINFFLITLEQANKPVWEYLKILFNENPRIALLQHLGFDSDKMTEEINQFISSQNKESIFMIVEGE